MMAESIAAVAAAWLLTYLMHSTVLLGAAWGMSRYLGLRRAALQELAWRVAMFGSIFTSGLQLAFALPSLGPTWVLLSELPPPETLAAPALVAATDPVADVAFLATDSSLVASSPWVILLAAMALICIASVMALGYGYLRLRRRLPDRRVPTGGALLPLFDSLRRQYGVDDEVRLTTSSCIQSPVAFGVLRPEICLPRGQLESMDGPQQRAILAHELAHILRRDPLWILLARFVSRALLVQPLNRLARRRLRDLAEHRCDDWALARTSDRAALASSLVEVAAGIGPREPCGGLVPAMSSAAIRLEDRVRRILAGGEHAGGPRLRPRLSVLLCLVAVVAALPTVSARDVAEPGPELELAPRLARLARSQRALGDEIEALRRVLAEHPAADRWQPLLALLKERVYELQEECVALQGAIENGPPPHAGADSDEATSTDRRD